MTEVATLRKTETDELSAFVEMTGSTVKACFLGTSSRSWVASRKNWKFDTLVHSTWWIWNETTIHVLRTFSSVEVDCELQFCLAISTYSFNLHLWLYTLYEPWSRISKLYFAFGHLTAIFKEISKVLILFNCRTNSILRWHQLLSSGNEHVQVFNNCYTNLLLC